MRFSPCLVALICVVAVLALSTASLFVRIAQVHAPSMVIAAYRLGLCTVVLTPFALTFKREELRSLSTRDLGLAGLAGVFLAFHFATWIASLEYTPVASSVVLVCTSPLFVALLAPITLKEPLSLRIFTGVGIAVAGGIIISLADAGAPSCKDARFSETAILGNCLALAGAVMVAGYFLVGRSLRSRVSLLTYVFLTYGSATLVLTALVPAAGQSFFGYSPTAYFWFLLLALIPQLIGHSTFNWVLRYVAAAKVSILVVAEPVGAIILAGIVLAEVPGPVQIAGAALVLGGIYLVSVERKPP